MLEVRSADDGFTLYDTEADEAVMVFASRAEADELVAELQMQELRAQLRSGSTDAVPGVH